MTVPRTTQPSSLFAAAEMESLPPRVRQAVDSIRFALTLKAGDMDGLSAVNIARDAGIVCERVTAANQGSQGAAVTGPGTTLPARVAILLTALSLAALAAGAAVVYAVAKADCR